MRMFERCRVAIADGNCTEAWAFRCYYSGSWYLGVPWSGWTNFYFANREHGDPEHSSPAWGLDRHFRHSSMSWHKHPINVDDFEVV